MIDDYSDDLMPRNEPMPASLIENAIKPFVPEVSLLFDPDKSRSFHLKSSGENNIQENMENYCKQTGDSIFPQNQVESYNTWKARNVQALHNITESSNMSEVNNKQISTSKKLRDSRSNQINDRETNFLEPFDSKSPQIKQDPKHNYHRHIRNRAFDFQSRGNEELTHKQFENTSQQNTDFQNKTLSKANMIQVNKKQEQLQGSETNVQMRKIVDFQREHYSQHQSSDLSVDINNTPSKKGYIKSHTCELHELPKKSHFQSTSKPKHFQNPQEQCECSFKNKNRKEYETERVQNDDLQYKNSKVLSALDIAKMNNQTIMDLYHIINLQNEQIFMLQQQFKQVMQIHVDCDRKTLSDKPLSHNCSCEQKCKRNFKEGHCTNSCQHNHCFIEEKSTHQRDLCCTSVNNKPKRSVGIMTTSLTEESENHSESDSDCSRGRRTKNKPPKLKKHQQKVQKSKSSPSNFTSPKKKTEPREKQKGKTQYISPHEKKTNKGVNKINNSQADSSFSLNEAELVIRTDDAEEGSLSPNPSIHIDLQDYNTSSEPENSGSSATSSCEEEECITEEESSDPQLGWTFYNKFVGQVNNILKKRPTPPHHEQSGGVIRKTPSNYVLDGRGTNDTENNWSKRVTFDGPPLEDRNVIMDNFMHARQFHESSRPHHNYRKGHDYRATGPDRVQDFMMYNYANGHSNLSFSTLRLLDRNDLLPPQMGLYFQEQQLLHDQQKGSKQHEKRRTLRKKEAPSRKSKPKQNRRTRVLPSSKLIDAAVMEHQSKLF